MQNKPRVNCPGQGSLQFLRHLPASTIDLICTCPPFAMLSHELGMTTQDCLEWFTPFQVELARVLKPQASCMLVVPLFWLPNRPVRSSLPYELLCWLCQDSDQGGAGWHMAQELFCYVPEQFAAPDDPQTRMQEAVAPVGWLSRSPYPQANNRRVLRPYTRSQQALMQAGDAPAHRPSGHRLSGKFHQNNGGAIPPNILATEGVEIGAPVRVQRSHTVFQYPPHFLEFALNLCTEPGARVCDPFVPSDLVPQFVQERGRIWVAQ